ncbi:MAG: hypothetical protein U0R78_02420 [Nocardioidaceae bacterium]
MRVQQVAAAALVAVSSLTLGACGADKTDANTGAGTGPVTIEVTFQDGTVTPSGETVEVGTGEPVELRITADEAGEIHVHSNPEQELAYDAGDSTQTITIDTPGTVDIESHDLDQVIVQLHVS